MNDEKYTCRYCFFKTETFYQQLMHLRDVHNETLKKKYFCDKCPFSAAKKWKVEEHRQYHEYIPGITLFMCDICEFRCPKQSQLHRHMMFTHVDEADLKTYSCKTCAAMFISKSGLKKHRKEGHYKDLQTDTIKKV